MKKSGVYNFINIKKVMFRNFSLYTKNDEVINVEETINNGVYCLAGANGLGKTTFLNAINYGLTGIVLESEKGVFLPNEIIQKTNKDYTTRYFKGRVNPKHENKAEIELLFTVNDKMFRIIRKFTNSKGLKLLEIFKKDNTEEISSMCVPIHRPEDIKSKYEQAITKEMGIGKFEYFLFLQLYLLTFDEQRRMIFWDERASTTAIAIAFNYGLDDTEKLLNLKREMDKFESNGRNFRWQATQIKNQIEKLKNTVANEQETEQLKEEYERLVIDLDKSEKTYNNIEVEYDTLLKRQNILNSSLLQSKIEYRKLFAQYSEPRSQLLDNPYISLSKKEKKCFLCGSSGHYVVENIEKNLHLDHCPVCDTLIDQTRDNDQDKILAELKKIDADIADKNHELENLIFETETKKVELERAEYQYNKSKTKLLKFEKANSNISFEKTGDAPIDALIKDYKNQFNKFDKQSKDAYKARDNLRPVYESLVHKINSAYKNAEQDFVPLFKHFARSFIGLNLNIFLKPKGRDLTLHFEMEGTSRTEAFQLSESQRFFLDIALRMALAVFLSREGNEATMLIDTPEGSLDIAYESRVGKMFADFVTEYNQNIIMTANINASQLLISLAEKCGKRKMQFRRMLEWTDLTEIQQEGEYLFEQVFKNIELALKEN
ncbi:AAA family ATPase [Candidatus Dojkabacteria bacterium]|uniref:AAA family ATPase n=1 Tax=Candidatus Dojkabacteria bacterium TaxID=2099670 RepID=A0A955HY82_9BACT|nr:AAA family ATPase [Candidatus Dojkabacteria bacterium]MCA9734296.1 AAA family ATPase [candidate division KSB1 bacterium]